jgi:predicted phage baseplate assembly protein
MTGKLNACGCCVPTPPLVVPFNRPGLSALAYRIGAYSTFLRDMLAQLHAFAIPNGPNQGTRPLAALTTRAADDPAIALLDAFAVMADVLTFYQERIANEGYLRTGTERLSVLQLARMIGYELGPGVAASAFLAFTVDTTPGAPPSVAVSKGFKVQNIPAQGKLPQTFETIEDLKAYASRNALHPRLTRPQDLALVLVPNDKDPKASPSLELFLLGINAGFPDGSSVQQLRASQVYPLTSDPIPDSVAAIPLQNVVYFSGTATNLQKGDRLLLVGRNDQPASGLPTVQTKVFIVRAVEAQADLNRTRVDLRADLGQTPAPPAFQAVKASRVAILAEPASLNLASASAVLAGSITESDLSAYVTMNNWAIDDFIALTPFLDFNPPPPQPPAPPTPPLPSDSAKLPAPDPGIFAMRTHVGIFGNNALFYKSLLAPANEGFNGTGGASGTGNFLYPNNWDDTQSPWPIWKDSITNDFYAKGKAPADIYLENVIPGIIRDSWMVLELPTGAPAVFRVGTVTESALAGFGLSGRFTGVRLTVPDGSSEVTGQDQAPLSTYQVRTTVVYAQSEALNLIDLPIADDILAGTTEVMLDGLVLGLRIGQAVAWSGVRAAGDAPGVTANEVLMLEQIIHVAGFTTLQFATGLVYSYVRNSVTVNANVAPATHGETVQEMFGNGDASQSNQSFKLKRPPLTYVAAATPTGAESTLTVRVNNLEWQETPSLFGAGATDQDYIVRREDDGTTAVTFGDGVTGARLPSGNQNVTATYRTGIGLDGNVNAGSLTLLQTRPPGIRAVINPLAASGAADPESLANARQNAPLKVLTLDRIVSLEDYENFARAFAGIGKAQAVALWSGNRYVVYLSIAGAGGAAVNPESALYTSLLGAIDQARDPVQQVLVANYQPLFFDIEAQVLVDQPRYLEADVFNAVTAALRDAFSFDARSFAQPVTASEVTAIIQSVPGVIASDLTGLFLVTAQPGGERFEGLAPILCASPARFAAGALLPAELLLVNPAGITLLEMQA